MTEAPLVVIGIGHDGPAGLTPAALAHIAQAKDLAGGRRQLAFFHDWPGETIGIDADLERLVQELNAIYRHAKTVVLASGDPLYYGIGRLLAEQFPPDALLFVPHVSSIQLAFARLKTSWHDAQVISLHGRPMRALLPALQNYAAKIALFTDANNHPAAVAQFLIEQGYEHYTMWVCEELGGAAERLTRWTPHTLLDSPDARATTFSPLNVMILLRHDEQPARSSATVPLIGIPEAAMAHRAGMITKREIRLITLCYLALQPADVLWDIGAGSGAVALEAARMAPSLRVFAVEKSADALQHITDNVQTFALTNVHPILGAAPEALFDLPDPHAVFIGGSGGRLADIIAAVVQRLRPDGRVVMNCITLEHFHLGWEQLKARGLRVDATSVQLAHARPLGKLHRFESDSPIFILQAHKA